MKAQDLRPGVAVNLDGQLYLITNYDHVKPGKGPAYAQVKLKGVPSGKVMEKRFRTSEEVEQAVLDRRPMEYLYSEADGAVFMDLESYEQSTLSFDQLGNGRNFLKENVEVTALVYQGAPLSLEFPPVVELKVVDTPPEVKGATATGQTKEAEMETGFKVIVPAFINVGDVIKVNTDSGEYLGRA